MRARIGLLSLLVVALSLASFPPHRTSAQAIDLQTAALAARELSILESEGAWDTLYDRLHPDSQLTVDRATLAYWYETYFAPNGPIPATIDGVVLTPWTWPVTGRTYPQAAEVAYTQRFAGGQTVQDVVRLVLAPDGTWRWFFGRSPEFVEQMRIEAGQAADPPSIPDRTGIPPHELFAEAIAAIVAVDPACFAEAGTSALPPVIGFDSVDTRGSESGPRPESVFYQSASVQGGFPDLVVNALTLGNGQTVESVARSVDASQLAWDGPPGSLPPRAFAADLAPGSQYLITYYEEYAQATGYMPVLTWGPPLGTRLYTVVGPAAGLINGLVADWSANAVASCFV